MNPRTITRSSVPARVLAALLALLLMLPGFATAESAETDPAAPESTGSENPVVVLRIRDYGDIYLEILPENAPITAENFLRLVDSGFYNGLTFHRIIKGFMAQGGCPLGNGTGGSGANIKGEFSANGVDNPLLHERGVLSMARSSDPDSASSQFFIMHATRPSLDGNYAAFGRVLAGMGVVDAMCVNAHVTDGNGSVPPADQPVITEAVRADRAEAEAAAAKEAENGVPGGVFDDPVTALSFPVPEGWSMLSSTGSNTVFSNGSDMFSLTSFDLWRQMGEDARARYAASGLERGALDTGAFDPAVFARTISVTAEDLAEQTVNGNRWYSASREINGASVQYRIGALNGCIFIFAASGEAAGQALDSVLSTLTCE